MVSKNTVLVLGAGASCHYGFPLGRSLLTDIKNIANRDSWSSVTNWLLMAGKAKNVTDIKSYISSSCRSKYAGSIDQVLETLASIHGNQVSFVGKAAIATSLLEKEVLENLYSEKFEQKEDDWYELDWYRYVFEKLTTGLRSIEDFKKNRLSVVTFNYDRSFEQSLYAGLQSNFQPPLEKLYEALSSLPVVHLHGQLGFLPWQTKDKFYRQHLERCYDHNWNINDIQICIESLRLVHDEMTEGHSNFSVARQLIRQSDQVIFVGFGFDSRNLERLGFINSDCYNDWNGVLLATRYGLTDHECELINFKIDSKITCWSRDENQSIVRFFKERVAWD